MDRIDLPLGIFGPPKYPQLRRDGNRVLLLVGHSPIFRNLGALTKLSPVVYKSVLLWRAYLYISPTIDTRKHISRMAPQPQSSTTGNAPRRHREYFITEGDVTFRVRNDSCIPIFSTYDFIPRWKTHFSACISSSFTGNPHISSSCSDHLRFHAMTRLVRRRRTQSC